MSALAVEEMGSYEAGSGSALLLLHGFGSTWRLWKPVLPLLLGQHRVIALTLPGHTGGVALQQRASPALIADALAAQLKARGIARAHIVGQSFGGYMAVELARRGIAQSVMGLSPGGAWIDESHRQALFGKVGTTMKLLPYVLPLLLPLLRFAALRKGLLKNEMEHGERMPAAELRDMLRYAVQCPIAAEVMADGIPAIQPLPPQNTVPVRILWCEHDKVLTFNEYGRPFLDTLGQKAPRFLPGCGHIPTYDNPAAVASEILAFTRSVEQAAPP